MNHLPDMDSDKLSSILEEPSWDVLSVLEKKLTERWRLAKELTRAREKQEKLINDLHTSHELTRGTIDLLRQAEQVIQRHREILKTFACDCSEEKKAQCKAFKSLPAGSSDCGHHRAAMLYKEGEST